MPDTPQDRILALGTLLAAVALVVMVAANWEAFAGSTGAVTVPVAAETRTATFDEPESLVPAPRETATRRNEAASARPGATAKPTLVIAAARGASWLEVRAGDSTGEELYFGTLQNGETTRFERLPVWVRLGASESVDVRLGGSRVRSLPISENGVVQFLASPEKITAASAG